MVSIRSKKQRLILSLCIGFCAAAMTVAVPGFSRMTKTGTVQETENQVSEPVQDPALLAWWGTLYPDFCFGSYKETANEQEGDNSERGVKVKLSFWLAKAFDWC